MKSFFILFLLIFANGCSMFSEKGSGQIIYHWERDRTGIEKFSRDHSECLRKAERIPLYPNISNWFYTEQAKNEIVVDWHSQKGIWATYVPYRGAQPLIINSLREDENISPKKYRVCMEDKGYSRRLANIPTITNIYVYSPQRVLQDAPTVERDF